MITFSMFFFRPRPDRERVLHEAGHFAARNFVLPKYCGPLIFFGSSRPAIHCAAGKPARFGAEGFSTRDVLGRVVARAAWSWQLAHCCANSRGPCVLGSLRSKRQCAGGRDAFVRISSQTRIRLLPLQGDRLLMAGSSRSLASES